MRKEGITSVYDAATAVHVIETEENLFGYLLDEVHGYAFVLMAFDKTEEVLAKYLEDHADVDAVGAFMAEMVKERDDMRAARMCLGGRRGRVGIVWCRLDWGS